MKHARTLNGSADKKAIDPGVHLPPQTEMQPTLGK
jgi:hypothetical protein